MFEAFSAGGELSSTHSFCSLATTDLHPCCWFSHRNKNVKPVGERGVSRCGRFPEPFTLQTLPCRCLSVNLVFISSPLGPEWEKSYSLQAKFWMKPSPCFLTHPPSPRFFKNPYRGGKVGGGAHSKTTLKWKGAGNFFGDCFPRTFLLPAVWYYVHSQIWSSKDQGEVFIHQVIPTSHTPQILGSRV